MDKKIGDIFEFVRNGASIKQDENKGGIPITRIETIWNSKIDANRFGYADIQENELDGYNKYLLEDGDILMTHINSVKHLGKCALYEEKPRPLIHGMNLLCLRPKPEIVDPKFIYYYFNSKMFKVQIPRITNKSVNQASFSAGNLKKLSISLPPLPIQKKITSILDASDAYRQKTKALIEKYDQLTQSLFLEMFGDPVKNEKGWETKPLFKVCKQIMGGGTPSKNKPDYYTGDIPWVTPKDMKMLLILDSINHITQEAIDNSSAKIIPKGSVLMVNRSGILKRKLPVAINGIDVTINQDLKAFIPKSEITNPEFMLNFFIAVSPLLLGKVRAVTADNIEYKQIRELAYPLPPISKQYEFSTTSMEINRQKQSAESSSQKAEELFRSLLQKAFNGELYG